MPNTTNQFQNTLAYTSLYSEGGAFDMEESGVPKPIAFDNTLISLNKNFKNNSFALEITQKGAYFLDFSFIAKGSNGSKFVLYWYLNSSLLQNYRSTFYQQSATLEYEVSNNFIIDLNQYDVIYPALIRINDSAENLSLIDIKLSSYNLQQLGIH